MIHKIFIDETQDSQKLLAYVNDKNRIYINVGDLDSDFQYSGYITLSIEDTRYLISELEDLIIEAVNNG